MPPRFMGLTGRPLSLMVSSIATMGFLLFGYDQGVMSGIITNYHFNQMFTATRGDSTMQGLVTAVYELGCFFGALFILWIGDRFGRRRSIMLGGWIMILGVVIQISSVAGHVPLAQFMVGRVITGVGNGINTSTIPTYQAECSHTSNRGLLICIEGGTVAFGSLIAYWIDFGSSYGPADLTWRFPIAFQIVFGLVIGIGMYWMPESPRWLMSREQYESAEISIAALRGKEINDHETQLQKTVIMDSIRASGSIGQKTPYSALFTGGKTQHFRRMLLGASSQFMQQIGGCNAVIYYCPVLFQDSLNLSRTLSMILGGVNMVVYAMFATMSWFLIEKAGRRKLFIGGTIGQTLSMVLIFACLKAGGKGPAKGAAVGLFTFIASFGATWLPLPWLYPAEINPIKTRSRANAISTCSNWLFNFLIVMITPIMIDNIHWATYLVFAVINACFLPVIILFYPETAHRSLEEIDLIFAKGYLENMTYVRASHELPFLTDDEIEAKAIEYGFDFEDDDFHADEKIGHPRRKTSSEAMAQNVENAPPPV
ncbi:MAG: hypothetical protein M1819_007146 [Sarea resinae]|nr:MAG: hypothetical protein M1819_007146 [Sarea resinae]